MGGAVAQKYAGKNHDKLSGLILLASATAPRMPKLCTIIKTFLKPSLWRAFRKALGCNVSDKKLRESGFFTGSKDGIDEKDMALALENLENEAPCVLFSDLYKKYSDNYKLSCLVQVVGSKTDAYFPEPSLKKTAEHYRDAGTEVQYYADTQKYYYAFDGICHDMMLDKQWESVAEVILEFIQNTISSKP